MEQDPMRVCELSVGLGDVDVVGLEDEPTEPLVVHIQTRSRPMCWGCGRSVWSKGTTAVRLVDLPAFGRAVRFVCRRSGVRCGWWICRRAGVWCGWCDASGVGVARRAVGSPRSPRPTTRSHRFVRR